MKHDVQFIADDRGSVSLWNLFWLTGIGLLMGVGLDVTTAMHTQSQLQTVADASSHAGALDVSGDPSKAVAAAVTYSGTNMPKVSNVVNNPDVVLGWWDHDAKTFTTNDPKGANAVQVLATRDTDRLNATATSFLGMIGFHAWDVNAVSVAAALEIPECLANGLFAGGTAEQTSNNTITGPYCVYGHTSFKISQNNLIQCGVQLITPGMDTYHNGTPPVPVDGCDDNYAGLTSDQMIAQTINYYEMPIVAELEYNNAKEVLELFIAGQPYNDPFRVIPPYITTTATVTATNFNNLAKQGKLVAGTLYNVSCAGTSKKLVPSGIVQNIGVYTDCEVATSKDKDVSAIKPDKTESGTKKTNLCDPDFETCENVDWTAEITADRWSCADALAAGFEGYTTEYDTAGNGTYRDGSTDSFAEDCGIEPGANGLWDNVMIFTSDNGSGNADQKAVTFPNNMQLGRIDGCSEGGGVRIYANGNVETPSGTTMHGIQIVTLGNVSLTAKANGVMGVTVQAKGDIKFTANGLMGGCPVDDSDVVMTVRPVAIVR